MKFVKAIAIMIAGPTLGVMIGFLIGALALRPDPNFVSNGGHAAPGDGILVILYVIIALAISTLVSLVFAIRVLRRKPDGQTASVAIDPESA